MTTTVKQIIIFNTANGGENWVGMDWFGKEDTNIVWIGPQIPIYLGSLGMNEYCCDCTSSQYNKYFFLPLYYAQSDDLQTQFSKY